MSIAAATLRMHQASGPALGKARLPVGATILSAVLHGSLAAGVVLTAGYWATEKPKTYVVNLVPAVAAVGSPQGKAEAPPTPTPPPPMPPRAEEVTRPAPPRPADLPPRQASKDMPPRPTEAPTLPDRSLPTAPTRAPALPKAGDKELPRMESTAKTPAPTSPTERPTTDVARAAPPPPPVPIGRPDGAVQGSGPMTLHASDFPFAWYLSRVQAKVTERWSGKALPGQQPVAVFDISRDGQVSRLAIEKSSGNSYYDQAALRAITEANPFPPLPAEFSGPTLRVHLGFNFSAERG